ncbi:hypothetical protein EON65_34330 [archaeon]|nr:MAG: hypothetical protein EON65_34330 [archaeon]
MAISLQQSLVSARLVITFGHFIALLTLFSTVEENVSLALADNYHQNERGKAMRTAWVSEIRD